MLLSAIQLLYSYGVLIGHIRSSPPGSRKFPILHLIGFAFATVGGFMDMLAVADPRFQVFSSCKSLGILVFGIFCAYFSAEQFFLILRERNDLFRKVDSLNQEFMRAQPLHRIGESTARISHEIKHYVSVLKSNNFLLRGKLVGDGDHPEMDRMARSTERLEIFVRSLLDYSNCTGSSRFEPLDLEAVVKACLDTQGGFGSVLIEDDGSGCTPEVWKSGSRPVLRVKAMDSPS